MRTLPLSVAVVAAVLLVCPSVLPSEDGGAEERTFAWSWTDADGAHSMEASFPAGIIPAGDVRRTWDASNLFPTALCETGGAVGAIASRISEEASSDRGRAACALAFVQSYVVYRSDTAMHGASDWWQTPSETLSTRTGDCEDSVILYCSLLAAMHIPSQMVKCTVDGRGHMYAVAVIDGTSVPAETVSVHGRMPLGTIPSGYADVILSDVII